MKVPPTPDALPLLTKGDIDTLWARLSEGESANRVTMAGRKLGTTIGKGSVIAYPMGKALREAPYRSHGR
ncbi:hypothetical protein STVIR_2738 [Streptomyces viridochromogenes Tue57]|uniref:Uncharacterized protein n=1 Tax=Streptomyces viridochromogenes Tue57 TaxID=1160705 RepID=L8PIQ6_STRVR|nr:hypothetical protein STVIR_2738 [Streptomyces viridochromogenes Tue57]